VAKGGKIINGRLSDKQLARTIKAFELVLGWITQPLVVILCGQAF
jgi:hypothetical protein